MYGSNQRNKLILQRLDNSMKAAILFLCIVALGAALPTYRSKRQLESSEETESEEENDSSESEEESKQKMSPSDDYLDTAITAHEGSNISTTEDNQTGKRMKATIVIVFLLGAAFSNPIVQNDVFDEIVKEISSEVNTTSVGDHASKNQTSQREILDEMAMQAITQIVQNDVWDQILQLTNRGEILPATNTTQTPTSSSSESSDESDDSDSSPENTSEDTSESSESTSEDKTSEESESNSLDTSDPDGNGDMRDDSHGSEEITRRNWIRAFNINLKSEEDSSVSESTSEETEEEDSKDSDSSESDTSESSESSENNHRVERSYLRIFSYTHKPQSYRWIQQHIQGTLGENPEIMEATLLLFCLVGTLSALPIPQEENTFTGSGDEGFNSNVLKNNYEVSLMLLGLSGESVGSGDGGFPRSTESKRSSEEHYVQSDNENCFVLPLPSGSNYCLTSTTEMGSQIGWLRGQTE
ncbi:hypothetical protein AAFF_G00358610 [Aldrovandia affinis]|uniref:Uncharacterized protein n=1 Tax=Aldrovandia affinis TaxID=143900 RepID=A0AAD7T9E7_9TELE|nr:hypothetical protein AAFF_G00358610 [Aldrovandia affinis]